MLAGPEVQLTPSEEQEFRKSWVASLWGGPGVTHLLSIALRVVSIHLFTNALRVVSLHLLTIDLRVISLHLLTVSLRVII